MAGKFFWLPAKQLARIPGAAIWLFFSFGNYGLAVVRKDGEGE